MDPEQRITLEGISLSRPNPVVANYVMAVSMGSLLLLSGHGSFVDGKPAHLGRLGTDLSTEQGSEAAAVVALNLIAALKAELGALSRVARFVKLVVFVNSTPDFTE